MPERTLERHYEIEIRLAARLRNSSSEARRSGLYKTVYDEYYSACEAIYGHPVGSLRDKEKIIRGAVSILGRFLNPAATFLEIGAGRCEISEYISRMVRVVYALDVASEMDPGPAAPSNMRFILTDGVSIPVPIGSVTVAYSNQVMEHLHPDDAVEQLSNIYRALAPSGVYICVTPNALSGPHDVSADFDEVATGLHLKEYTNGGLSDLLKRTGFRRVRAIGRSRFVNKPLLLPTMPYRLLEALAGMLPRAARRRVARARLGPFALNHLCLAAFK